MSRLAMLAHSCKWSKALEAKDSIEYHRNFQTHSHLIDLQPLNHQSLRCKFRMIFAPAQVLRPLAVDAPKAIAALLRGGTLFQVAIKRLRHSLHIRLIKHVSVVPCDLVKIDPACQIFPPQLEVEVRTLRPLARLHQHNLAGIRLRVIQTERRMND